MTIIQSDLHSTHGLSLSNAMQENKTPFAQRHVIILGARIIGCAAARQLLLQGYRVKLVAEYLPGDQSIYYASNWAGAAWSFASGMSHEEQFILASTHRHLLRFALHESSAGVHAVDTREYLEEPPHEDSGAQWGKKFRDLEPGEYPNEFAHGWSYDSLVVDPPLHLAYLKKSILDLGGEFIRYKTGSLKELFHKFSSSIVFVNASGWASKHLTDVRDQNCYPCRGQNVFFKTSNLKTMYLRNGKEYTYIIPRPVSGGLILGGVKQPNDLSSQPDMDIAKDEIARAHRLAPEVVPADPPESSLQYIVGIRPARHGGFRLESEWIGGRLVLHAYGADGKGFARSYGVADELVKMVQQAEYRDLIGS